MKARSITGASFKATKACRLAPELEAVQHLMPIDPDDFERLKASIKADGIRDPLRGYQTESGFNVLSGANRLKAAQEIGLDMVPVENVETPDREAYAIDENLSRRHLSAQRKRELVAYLIAKNPRASNLSIAKRAGVDDKTVGAVRKSRSEIPNVGRIDSRGRKVGTKTGKKTAKKASPRLSATQKAEAKKLKADIARLEKELAKKRARLAQLGG